MGLGKTAQACTMLHCLRTLHGVHAPFLVVAPLSTLQARCDLPVISL